MTGRQLLEEGQENVPTIGESRDRGKLSAQITQISQNQFVLLRVVEFTGLKKDMISNSR